MIVSIRAQTASVLMPQHIEIPSSAEYIIFNNGSGDQSSDIKLEGTNKIYENGSWRDFS